MKIYLIDINSNIISAWNHYFSDMNNVYVVHADFNSFMQKYKVDCVVSPGNSHGIMAGGYDRALSEYFGWNLTERVQIYIKENYNGLQPVGTSFIIDTGMPKINLIHCPTMNVPSKIQDENVVYECTKSTLKVANENNIESIVIPAFGGACGGLQPDVIANKMHCAIKEYSNLL